MLWGTLGGVPKLFPDRGGEKGKHEFVVTNQRVSLPPFLGRAFHHISQGAVMGQKIHVDRRDVP